MRVTEEEEQEKSSSVERNPRNKAARRLGFYGNIAS